MSGTDSANSPCSSSGKIAFEPIDDAPPGVPPAGWLVTTTLCEPAVTWPSPGFAGKYCVVPLFCGAITTAPPLSAGIAAANDWSRKTYGHDFDQLDPDKRVEALKAINGSSNGLPLRKSRKVRKPKRRSRS